MPWFHGKISRDETEKLLLQKEEDGWFLVRESAHYVGDYTLSVSCDKKVDHYRILRVKGKLTIDEESMFDDMIKLVKHYEADSDGLSSRLIRPLVVSDLVNDDWKIPESEIVIKERVGKGEFSEVYKATYKNKDVAVKKIQCGQTAMGSYISEVSLMTKLRHKNLVNLLGVVISGDVLCIVMEHVACGSLLEYLRSRGRNVIRSEDQLRFAMDCCSGMAYLESMHIVHRDLAARNVLIDNEGHAKISDFGLASATEEKKKGGKIPIKWTAPEALRDNLFTTKSDVWSFGILLWELYSFGRVPYPRIPMADVTRFVESGNRMEPPENCPPKVAEIMLQAWNMDPKGRPTFAQLRDIFTDLRSTPV